MSSNHRLYRFIKFLMVPFLAVMLVACGGDDEVASDEEETLPITPGAGEQVPDPVEGASLRITDGSFGVEELLLQEGEPTVLQIVNNDDVDYQFEIGDLVAPTSIPAGATTSIEFTTPNAETYTARLLSAEDDSVLAETEVTVQGAGGIVD